MLHDVAFEVPCWGEETLLQLACEIEGHPDNVAPAIYGGIQVGIHNGERWMSERVKTPSGLQAVVFIPDAIGTTKEARAVLKAEVPRTDAVFNIGRVAYLVNALASGNLDNLKEGCEDSLHQPARGAAVYKHLFPMMSAATDAGASCCYLSGAGPAVLALTSGAAGDIFTQREKERVDSVVAEAMLAAATRAGVRGEVYISAPIGSGAYVSDTTPSLSSKLVKYGQLVDEADDCGGYEEW